MLSSCLLSGLIIGSISTCVYALITDKKDRKDRKDTINTNYYTLKEVSKPIYV